MYPLLEVVGSSFCDLVLLTLIMLVGCISYRQVGCTIVFSSVK